MKRIRKRLTALLLSCFLAFSGVAGSYQTAQAAEIVAGYTIGQILESILLSFGISIFTTEMIQKGTSATWWDTDGSAALKPYYDDLEQAYEEQRFKVINGGGGQNPEPSPTPAPGTTPIPFPTTVPVPGDIPTFQELVAPALAGTAAFINMTQGAWECMAEAVSSLWNKMMGRANNVDSSINADTVNLILSSGYPYYSYDGVYLKLCGEGSFVVYDTGSPNHWDLQFCGELKIYCNNEFQRTVSGNGRAGFVSDYGKDGYYFSNLPMFQSESEGLKWRSQQLANADKYVKENIWVHPDLQDTYQNNGKLEYPQQAPQPLQIPSGDQLADLSKKLNPEINTEFAPEMAPNYIQELIQQLQKGLNPDPDPDPDPNPDPNPNPNPNPDPDPDPDPNPTGSPDPEPTKAPEEDSSSDVDPKDYAIDLRKIFPFCIPFDLIHLLNVLDAEPEAPRFEIPIDLEADNPFTGKKIVDYHTKIVIDMSDYEQPIKVIRIFEIMFFILALLLITRDQMIKG